MNPRPICFFFVMLAPTATAHAWEFRCRFVERVGNQDVPYAGNFIDASNGNVRNIRIQFGVFDDNDGPAPAGGFVGWNVGSLSVSGTESNSDERRNPGRLAPYNFAPNGNGMPPPPAGDPFTTLTDIDSTLGTQSPVWICDANGNAPPQPPPTVRGRNTYSSVFSFSIDPNPGATSYSIVASGNLIAATSWGAIGTPIPPDCPPPPEGCPIDCPPGSVTYAPITTPPRPFTCTFTVIVPAPAASSMLITATLLASCRRRRLGGTSG